MSISKVTTSGSAGASSTHNNVVESLQKQKVDLAKQIQQVRDSKQDSKVKAEKIQELTARMADLDQQIMQAKLDAKQREIEEAQAKNAEKVAAQQYEQQTEESNNQGVILSPSLSKLLSATKNSTDYETMHTVRRKIKGEMAVAKSEIAHSRSGGSVQYQLDVVGKSAESLAKLENKMVRKVDEFHSNMKKSVKLGVIEAEKARENKDEVKENRDAATDDSKVDNTGDTTAESAAAPVADASAPNAGTVAENQEDKTDKKKDKKTKPVDVLV